MRSLVVAPGWLLILTELDQIDAGGTKDVEIIVPLKYLSNLWRTLEITLIT